MKFLCFFILCFVLLFGHTGQTSVSVSDIHKVFDNSEHNAFTDLIVFDGYIYLTFRSCPDGHGVSPNASIIILRSKDLKKWDQVHQWSVPLRDTRDPHFLVFKNKLFVYSGTWFSGKSPITDYKKLDVNLHLGYAVYSNDGVQWLKPTMLEGTFGHYIWRARKYQGMAYLCARRKIGFEVDLKGEPSQMKSLMLESSDGLIWQKRSVFQEIQGDETAFIFSSGGEITGIGRRKGNAQLLKSQPPYDSWSRSDLGRYIGGPLIASWGDEILVGGRRKTKSGPRTFLAWLNKSGLEDFALLPSSGDNSYPGFVELSGGEAIASWYSSHEGSASIYMARLSRTSPKYESLAADKKHELENILLYQRDNGGWNKNIRFNDTIDFEDQLNIRLNKYLSDTTLDNGATHKQIRFLAEVYSNHPQDRIRNACEKGVQFLFNAQLENGGWPQRYPKASGYHRYITYNDGAMIGALSTLRDISNGDYPFEWTTNELRLKARKAFKKGVECILKCQIKIDGELTAWGQQHDPESFEPRPARSFEPASICSSESVGVIKFLMTLENPTPKLQNAIISSVNWLNGPAKIRFNDSQDQEYLKNRYGKNQPTHVWSRLYELNTNKPIFGDRDSRYYYRVNQISKERQEGYAWYNTSPAKLISNDYPKWLEKWNVK